jgi:hypothetical protein
MQKNALPEFWFVKNDMSRLFRDEVVKYLLERYGAVWPGIKYMYYGYDGSNSDKGTDAHNLKEKFKNNAVELELEEFIRLKNQIVETNSKAIVAYKLKDECKHLEKAAAKICEYVTGKLSVLPVLDGNFNVNSHDCYSLRDAGVLDLWFNPIYKSQSKVLVLGSNNDVEVFVSKNEIKADGKIVSVQFLEELLNLMTTANLSNNPGWSPIRFPKVRIGCSEFAAWEIKRILDTFNEINA